MELLFINKRVSSSPSIFLIEGLSLSFYFYVVGFSLIKISLNGTALNLKSNCHAFIIRRGIYIYINELELDKIVVYYIFWKFFSIKNYLICFALQYHVAQMYMVMKMQQKNTTGTEGVEVLENRPFEDNEFGKGQYTFKIYRLQR